MDRRGEAERGEASVTPRPFTITVPDEVLADLRARLERVRWPDEPPDAGWRYGTSVAYMQELVEHWRSRYDWRAHEARLNTLRQFAVDLAGIDVHFIHARSPHDGAMPLVLTHGWPGTMVEFLDVIEPLTNPDDPADAFPSERLPQLLRDVFAAAGGTHDDWDEYDRVMAAERRAAVLVTPARITSNAGA